MVILSGDERGYFSYRSAERGRGADLQLITPYGVCMGGCCLGPRRPQNSNETALVALDGRFNLNEA
jgi:hypothetical protein